jgi:tripartite-type tricarboxylate transporter receptor subunit TctC
VEVCIYAATPGGILAAISAKRAGRSVVIVEPSRWVGGMLGAGLKPLPDGYTIGIGHLGTHVFNGALQNLGYDLQKDLAPIILLPSNYSVIVTKKDVPAKNLKELVAWLKANPDQASAATAGIGSIAHVASVYFQEKTGAALRIIPYRGGAAAVNDVVAGHVTFIFDQLSAGSVGLYRSGKLKPFAVTAKARLPSVPDLPTVDEAGIPGLYVSTWYGLWAPKGTPREIVAKLNAAAVAALAEPELRKRLDAQSSVVPPREQQTPEALAAFQKAEIEKWWPVIKAANIKVQ